MVTGDPLYTGPNDFPFNNPIYPGTGTNTPVYPGTTYPIWTQPVTTKPATKIDLEELIKLVKGTRGIEDVTIEQRLMNIETSLTVILELLGTILMARQQQIEQPKEEQS